MMPGLTPELIQEITAIIFDYPSPPLQPCDIIFIFGGSHPGLWQTAAEAYRAGCRKPLGFSQTPKVWGAGQPGVKYHWTWRDGATPESHVIKREMVGGAISNRSRPCPQALRSWSRDNHRRDAPIRNLEVNR